MTQFKTLHIIALLTIGSIYANAQNGVNSPYSRYGFGLLSDCSTGFNKGMGGVAQGFRDGQSVNLQNPASYSAVDSMTALFDFGLTLQNGNYKIDHVQKNIRNTSVDYFAMHFRAAKGVGVALGIVPVSNIKYGFSSNPEPMGENSNITSAYSFSGDGGLHKIFLGAGWRPFKPISIGMNAAYIYGDYTHSMTMSFNDNNIFSLARVYSADIRTFDVNFGLQYIQPLGTKNKMVIGASYTLGHDVNNEAYRSTQTLSSSITQAAKVDTINNAFQMPSSYAVGLTYYHSNKLRIGIDAELQKWSDCRFPDQETNISSGAKADANTNFTSKKGQLNDRTKLAIGADWTPNTYSSSYLSRMTYKMGGYYSQSYAKADLSGTAIDKPIEFGLSAGVSLPISNRNLWHNSPKINVSVQWVHSNIPYLNTTTMKQTALSENYLKLCLGITFSERWFYKWKIE